MQKCELIFWNSKYPGDSGSRQKAGLLFGYTAGRFASVTQKPGAHSATVFSQVLLNVVISSSECF